MLFIITIISIFVLGFLVWVADKFLPFQICPICTGVAGTWIWLLIGYFIGYQINPTIIALLMGGSVVGVAYKIELGKKLKTLFIPAGFILVYSILIKEWLIFFVSLVFLLVILFLPKNGKKGSDKEKIEELKKKMDNCC